MPYSPVVFTRPLGYLWLILLALGLSGCESCVSTQTEGPPPPEKVQLNQALCEDQECEPGVSFGCHESAPLSCAANSQGCGEWADTGQEPCEEDTQWCYHGQCFSYEEIPLPEPRQDDSPGLFELGVASEAIPEEITVIPYEAFMNGLKMEMEFGPATETAAAIGRELNMAANDLNVLGLSVVMQEEEEFYGDVFVVMMDPHEASSEFWPSSNEVLIESTQYFIAVMPGFSGPTSWKGQASSQQFVLQGQRGTPSGSCCRGGQPPESCKLGVDDSLPQPHGCYSDSTGLLPPECLATSSYIDPLLQDDPAKQPFRVGGSYEAFDQKHTMQVTMRGNDMPAVTLYVSQGIDYHRQKAQDFNVSPSVSSELVQTLMFDAGSKCEFCDPAQGCGNPDEGWDVDWQDSAGVDNGCGGSASSSGYDVGQCWAFSAGGGGMLPPDDCGGICFGCAGGRHEDGVPDGPCALSMTTSQTLTSGFGSSTTQCSNGRPHWCKWADGGDCDECDASCEAAAQQLWVDMMGCGSLNPNSSTNSSCCGENCACQEQDGGVSRCIACNDNGDCAEAFIAGPDKRYFLHHHKDEKIVTRCKEYEGGQRCTATSTGRDNQVSRYQCENGSQAQCESAVPSTVKEANGVSEGDTDWGTVDASKKGTVVFASEDKEAPENSPVDTINDAASQSESTKGKGAAGDVDSPNRDPLGEVREGVNGLGGPNVTAADPVLIGEGSLAIAHHDMSFPGPVVPLQFSRFYNSRDDERSILGSNWSHNFDSHLRPIQEGNYESWMPKYCIAQLPIVTCAEVRYPDGRERLFLRGARSKQNIFYPQAGSGDTLRFYTHMWELHAPDESLMVFNEHGYLVTYRDRFQNGYTIEYESTPLYRIYQRHCRADDVTAPDHEEHVQCDEQGVCVKFNHSWAEDSAVSTQAMQDQLDFAGLRVLMPLTQDTDSRVCRVVGAMLGDSADVQLSEMGWETNEPIDGDLFRDTLNLSLAKGTLHDIGPLLNGTVYEKLGQEYNLFDYRAFDEEYVQWVMNRDAAPQVPTGHRKLRPVRVHDDLGRTLSFNYYRDINDKLTYGLLEKVIGPGGVTSMTYTYAQPANYPERTQEMFLVSATRADGATLPSSIQAQPSRTQQYEYNWPEHGFESYDAYEDDLYDSYLDFYTTHTGCTHPPEAAKCRVGGGSGAAQMAVCISGQLRDVFGNILPSSSGSGCATPETTTAPGNPCLLATRRHDEYISRVADNIVVVRLNGTIELESRYEVDPSDQSFDRVLTQHYGGLEIDQYPSITNTVDRTLGWQTNLPEFRFEYVGALPTQIDYSNETSITASDAVEDSAIIPAVLKQRYPLDAATTDGLVLPRPSACMFLAPGSPGHCADIAGNYTAPSCRDDYTSPSSQPECSANAHFYRRLQLPGVTPIYEYYPMTAAQATSRDLMRTRLTCRQLAEEHLRDAHHNDLLKLYTPPAAGQIEGIWGRTSLNRVRIERDTRRICAWLKTTDRDGDVKFAGLNFYGQEIVTAVALDGQNPHSNLVITEQLVNADGLTVEERHATLDHQAWSVQDGYTEYVYDGYNEEATNGWDRWALQPWAKRFNLKRVIYNPARHQPGLNLAHSWEAATGSLSGEEIMAREVEFDYEPIFNQVSRVKYEAVTASGQRELLSHTIYSFDYQEFDEKSLDFKHALERVKGWNLNLHMSDRLLASNTTGTQVILPTDKWVSNVLLEHFYGASQSDYDLNGDGVRGFPNPEGGTTPIFRGFVVRRSRVDVADPSGQAQRTDVVWPAPHGLPGRVITASGRDTLFEYRSFGTDRYGDWPVSDQEVSIYNRGLLGRVQTRQQRNTHGDEEGAFDAGDLLAQGSGWQPCDEFKGAYAWLMPQGCASEDAGGWLTQLGVPLSVANKLLDAQDTEENWSSVTLLYNELGHTRESWSEDHRAASWTYDTDGLVLEHLDANRSWAPAGAEPVRTVYERDERRRVIREKVFDEQSQLAHQVQRQFDMEGHLLAECTDLDPHGCSHALNFSSPLSFMTPRGLGVPFYLLTTYRYTPEGQLERSMDESNMRRQLVYDGRGLVTADIYQHEYSTERRSEFEYDTRGRLTHVAHGTATTRSTLGAQDEYFVYDGFDQMRTSEQRRALTQGSGFSSVSQQRAYNARGDVVAERVSDLPYQASSVAGGGQLGQESLTQYDGYGRPVVVQEHGLERTSLKYDPRGRVRKQQVQPLGANGQPSGPGEITWMTHDAQGRPAWVLNQRGDMSLTSYDVPGRSVAEVTMRRDASQDSWLVTTSERAFNERGEMIDVLVTGALGELKPTSYEYDAMGRVVSVTTPDQQTTTTEYNMVGWVKSLIEPQDAGLMTPQTSYVYNRRGQVVSLTEPGEAGETTRYEFNIYGERTKRYLPGVAHAFDEYEYDGYGRLKSHERWSESGQLEATQSYSYVQRADGESSQQRSLNVPSLGISEVDRELDYDKLGRLIASKDYNLEASQLAGLPQARVITRELNYDALGRAVSERQVIEQDGQTLHDESMWHTFTAEPGTGLWSEQVTYPSGTSWERLLTHHGRLRQARRLTRQGVAQSSSNEAKIAVDWVGDLYAGRAQTYESGVDPLVERREFDGLGRAQEWTYRAVALNATGQPTNPSWGQSYCHGTWQSDCELALLTTSLRYDVMDRLRGMTRRFGQPVFLHGAVQPASDHKASWRGYEYGHRGFLTHEWQGEELSDLSVFDQIVNHSDPQRSEQIQVASASKGREWLWERDETGDLSSISPGYANSDLSRWAHTNTTTQTARRNSRHKLDEVTTPALGEVSIAHDARGRVAEDAGFAYRHGADDRLVRARALPQTSTSL